MEKKHFVLSALSVGVGVGLGLASGKSINGWNGRNLSPDDFSAEQIEQELLRLVIDGRDSKVTFDEFPYYLR